jgi:hypothetical protein
LRRSNPFFLRGYGLLRFARNDGLPFVVARESGRSSIPKRQ